MSSDNSLDRRDLDLILEVNKKSIEIETEVAEQNEKIIELLESSIDNCAETDQKVTNLDNKLNSLEIKLSNMDPKLTNLESKVINLDPKITNLENKIINNELAISNLELSISKKMDLFQDQIKSHVSDSISPLKSQTDALSKEIFQAKVVLTTGVIGLIIQIIQIFLKK